MPINFAFVHIEFGHACSFDILCTTYIIYKQVKKKITVRHLKSMKQEIVTKYQVKMIDLNYVFIVFKMVTTRILC